MASDVANSLRDRRQKAWHEAKELLDRTSTENRDFSGEEEGKWSALNKEIDQIDERLKTVLDAESRSKETEEVYNRLGSRPAEGRAAYDSAREEIRQWMINPNRGAMEVHRANKGSVNPAYLSSTEFRTLVTNSGSASSTVPVDFYDQLISYLIEVSGLLQAGPSVLNTAGGETIQIPVVAAHLTGTSAAQGASITAADPSFKQATLAAIKFGSLTQLSRELIDDTAVDLLGYLAMSSGRAIGNVFGQSLVQGLNGISGGLQSGVSIGVTGATGTGGAPTYANLVDLEYSVIAPYRQSRSCYWLAADKTIGGFRKLTDTQGRPVWEPSMVLGAPDLLLGKPIVADPYMPAVATGAQSIAFGDFSQYFVRLAGGLRFERSDDFAFGSDLVTFRCLLRGDGNWGDVNAVKLFKAPIT